MTFPSETRRAWDLLEQAVVSYRGNPVGTVAARDPTAPKLNYDQVFLRDFAVAALAFLMRGEVEIVRNFLKTTAALQSTEKQMACFRPGKGLMPASFRVLGDEEGGQRIEADFGERAIARVAPVDSGFWWLILLRAYQRMTGDLELARSPSFQRAIRLILDLCLTARFDMFPTLLVPDGSFMIDRRMGVYGHPLGIQALFFTALRAARELLDPGAPDDGYRGAVTERLGHLLFHLRAHYWLDARQVDMIRHRGVEEYGKVAANPFNIYPETMPPWLPPWLPEGGGYFAGNLGPGRMDFRVFLQGNLWAVLSSLADDAQVAAVMDLVELRWNDLVGHMPAKACFPALEGDAWRALTGGDPKNAPWSYHNGGNWPCLLWMLAAAALRAGRPALARKAVEVAGPRLAEDGWPEYYDGRRGGEVGREARRFQTWSIAGYLAAAALLEDPRHLALVTFDEDPEVMECSTAAAVFMERSMNPSP